MKKAASLFMTAVMLAATLSVFAFPVFAAGSEIYIKDGYGWLNLVDG